MTENSRAIQIVDGNEEAIERKNKLKARKFGNLLSELEEKLDILDEELIIRSGGIEMVDERVNEARTNIDEILASNALLNQRIEILEKVTSFERVAKPWVEEDEIETKMRETIEKLFLPSQKRVLELQHKLGDLS